MIKFKRLDVVRTEKGTVAVVTEISQGEACIAFAENSGEKVAWYRTDELEIIGNVLDMVAKR